MKMLENYCRGKIHFTGVLYLALIAFSIYLKSF